jgi:hypothetical protein
MPRVRHATGFGAPASAHEVLRATPSASLDQPIRELLFGSGNRGTYRFLFGCI